MDVRRCAEARTLAPPKLEHFPARPAGIRSVAVDSKAHQSMGGLWHAQCLFALHHPLVHRKVAQCPLIQATLMHSHVFDDLMTERFGRGWSTSPSGCTEVSGLVAIAAGCIMNLRTYSLPACMGELRLHHIPQDTLSVVVLRSCAEFWHMTTRR